MSAVPAFARQLCDDAAVFPPGLLPLADAVPAHRAHRAAAYAGAVGPLVLAAPALRELGGLLDSGEPLELAVTAPSGPEQAAAALSAARGLPVAVRAVEVAVPPELGVPEFFAALDGVEVQAPVFVEVPRDARRPAVLAACAERGHPAKFRTGGVTAELYPDEAELAAAVAAAVRAGVPFKATAGLHHAIRNTDPETGFEQHGFLNLLLATDAALGGADEAELAAVLAERDAGSVSARVRELGASRTAAARAAFVSFGTCSITEPLGELADLGLVPASLLRRGRG
ncbi:hypothetical protein [Prauserella muralis]|uniref:Transaldolase n=1 Tax=Prauserella muralis TaxID=588067 RepID=A0A2V4AQC1_9PSEU|nr:hypothetical protein [Prauserella muralis]PXY22900.1 hypothetical protein BAY60_20375 [Prauserella muralis]